MSSLPVNKNRMDKRIKSQELSLIHEAIILRLLRKLFIFYRLLLLDYHFQNGLLSISICFNYIDAWG